MQKLIDLLRSDFSALSFVEAETFSWSPQDKVIYFNRAAKHAAWSLLHEAGHMMCQHNSYDSDIELLRMEIEAWQAAKELATKYHRKIDDGHIEQCLDSYRDWLHQRSKCTVCDQAGLEQDTGQYQCVNCGHSWQVGHDRFCRVYRKKTEPQVASGTLF